MKGREGELETELALNQSGLLTDQLALHLAHHHRDGGVEPTQATGLLEKVLEQPTGGLQFTLRAGERLLEITDGALGLLRVLLGQALDGELHCLLGLLRGGCAGGEFEQPPFLWAPSQRSGRGSQGYSGP